MARYTAKERQANATVGADRYPIGDKRHARLALDFINSGNLSGAAQAVVRRKAHRFGVTAAKDTTQ